MFAVNSSVMVHTNVWWNSAFHEYNGESVHERSGRRFPDTFPVFHSDPVPLADFERVHVLWSNMQAAKLIKILRICKRQSNYIQYPAAMPFKGLEASRFHDGPRLLRQVFKHSVSHENRNDFSLVLHGKGQPFPLHRAGAAN